ncbi:MAG: ferredoxin [Synergistaceae bacterium]|jgi:ferredoxin|nr:ferredoxin [Synergistaceae bacterium]
MKIVVDQRKCIGCGVCSQVCPEVFRVNETTSVAEVMAPDRDVPCVREAESSCPVSCIRIE